MPVSTTHVLSAAVLGTVAGTRGEKVNMHTAGKIALTWFTTLPGTVIVSFVLALIFTWRWSDRAGAKRPCPWKS